MDSLPFASITFVVGVAIIIGGCITGEFSAEEALELVGFVGVGSGAIGIARNGSGRGLK